MHGREEVIARAIRVWKALNGRWVLKGVSLDIKPGEAIVIHGPNGSGKTTLLKILAGLLAPTRGNVFWSCKPYTCVGYMAHTPMLYPLLTVGENLRFFSMLYGMQRLSPASEKAVKVLGLTRYMGSRVSSLSFGWSRRADFARSLVGSPRVLLLDEPFTGMDEETESHLRDLLGELVSSGIAVVATTPRLDKPYRDLAGKTYLLQGGLLECVSGC